MEISYKGEIRWVEELVATLSAIDVKSLNTTRVKWATIYAQWLSKKEAPVDKWHLRRSISIETGATQWKVFTKLPYGIYVHEWTKPHIIRVKNAKVLSNWKTFFGKVVRHPWTTANPFFTRASERADKPSKDKYADMLTKFLDATVWW